MVDYVTCCIIMSFVSKGGLDLSRGTRLCQGSDRPLLPPPLKIMKPWISAIINHEFLFYFVELLIEISTCVSDVSPQ